MSAAGSDDEPLSPRDRALAVIILMRLKNSGDGHLVTYTTREAMVDSIAVHLGPATDEGAHRRAERIFNWARREHHIRLHESGYVVDPSLGLNDEYE